MFHIDNKSGIAVMPPVKDKFSDIPLFFTEGGNGVLPSWPGADWFNIVQTELLNILNVAGITPSKTNHTQLVDALKTIFPTLINAWIDKGDARGWGILGDGSDETEKLQQLLNDRAGKTVYLPGEQYVFSETLYVHPFTTLTGTGRSYDKVGGTFLLAKGTGARQFTIPGATSVSIANPDAGGAYLADSGARGDTYSTIDYSVPFSAAIILGVGARLEKLSVLPWFNGVTGYLTDNTGVADDWDVGIWARNANGWSMDTAASYGHWRKAGLLLSSHDTGNGLIPSCELGQASFCEFGGGYGVSIRSPRNASGASNYGFAGTDFINCRFRGFNHQSLHLATSAYITSPLSKPSGALEFDGGVMRGVQFLNNTFLHRDDVMIFHGAGSEFLFDGNYYESQSIRVNGAWMADDKGRGSRFVGITETVAAWHNNCSSYAVDTTPYFSVRDISIRSQGRYDTEKSGVFSPSTAKFDDWQTLNFSSSIGYRLRSSAQQFNISAADGTNVFGVNAAGNTRFTNTLTSLSESININRTVAGSQVPVLRTYTTGNIQLGDSSGAHTLTLDGAVIPYADGMSNVGMNAARFGTIFAKTGTINTSEATEKSDPVEISALSEQMSNDMDAILNAWGGVSVIAFRWLSSLAEKGNGEKSGCARWHFGVIAQQVRDAFAAHGIDGTRFGLLCYDEWEDVTRPVIATREVVSTEIIDGNEVEKTDVVEYETGETEVVFPAGSRWGIRPDQCAWLEAAYQRRRCDRIEERLSSLEAR
ncbi:tail fiber domain-containing protein [Citrobacter sp. RHBSTW-00976]|uniref:tail fiber domain-containing protein n=1 Tax=Citrobacter sp. RHBSTW-00976 TaxID=2742674 RepID=UPI0015EADA93|nr:tail fiber domain-containing protein [Citrobacter sp. RHBSTW-00976]QLR62508.1 tail fiber domain-containing protein [Citrobacter sp. RHBSTW-00976]